MDVLFKALRLLDWHDDLYRNIVSLRQSENLFDDLSASPVAQQVAQQLELRFKPLTYESTQPILARPFEETLYDEAIGYPFSNWRASRYSDGSFGVWYGTGELTTCIHETVYHWRYGFLADAGWHNSEGIRIERRVHLVRCDAALINLQQRVAEFPALVDKQSYQFTQSIGRRLQYEGHPGLVSQSARCDGRVFVLFTPRVLTQPRVQFYLTYELQHGAVDVYRQGREKLLTIAAA